MTEKKYGRYNWSNSFANSQEVFNLNMMDSVWVEMLYILNFKIISYSQKK